MDVISAIATAKGRGGVAIVRLSGDGALGLAQKMFSRRDAFEPNVMYAGEIDCGVFRDFGLCVWFRAPKSFTGEDVVEFHCHGGSEIARGVLKRTLSLGARLAERGEFTKRAFLNGKLSLSAAEGMADMINAESEAEVRAGYALYNEKLTSEVKRLSALLKECLAEIDADIDYPEEDLEVSTGKETEKRLDVVCGALRALLKQYGAGRKLKSGVSVVICGKPNAGKSTLLNALLGYDRAIVSDEAGTTRDLVEGTMEYRGVLFRLVDTAGLHDSNDRIEQDGIRRAKAAIDGADVILWLKEDEPPVTFPEGTPLIRAGAKSDVGHKADCDVLFSAKTGEGMDALKELVYERGYGRENEGVFVMEERHYAAAGEALKYADEAREAISRGAPAELYAEDVGRALNALGKISGESATVSVIDEIFEKFCVGK